MRVRVRVRADLRGPALRAGGCEWATSRYYSAACSLRVALLVTGFAEDSEGACNISSRIGRGDAMRPSRARTVVWFALSHAPQDPLD